MLPGFKKARRYVHTLRYLRPVQVFGRLYGSGKRRLGLVQMPEPPGKLQAARLSTRTPFLYHDPWNTPGALQEGEFCFLNRSCVLGRPVSWQAEGTSVLWRFNLHYFHYLYLLDLDAQQALCLDWMVAHPISRGVAWHPYPTSLRIVNWCKSGEALLAIPEVVRSLYRQAGYLYRGLEFYHPGNHYLENARALIMAGRAFAGQGEADQWLEKGLAIFRHEIPAQVEPDGGYFERTPMYHALMLWAFLDVLNVLPHGHIDEDWLRTTCSGMTAALRAMCHPDGQVALFNDATFEVAPPPALLLDYAEALLGHRPEAAPQLPETGLYRYDDDAFCLLVDGGPIGPDHLPAHAHADIFTYELSVEGLRFVTDTGVYEYDGPRRAYDRSTAAHNTVAIDRRSQAECWGSFRVARRFPPRDVEVNAADGCWHFGGTFDGYATLLGDDLVHHRAIRAEPGAIHIEDTVEGRGRHEVDSRIHLHPDVNVMPVAPGRLKLEREGVVVLLETDPVEVVQEPTPYSPRFGVSRMRTTLVLRAAATPPLRLSYTFRTQ